MRKRDTFDVLCSTAAVAGDALAVFGGILLAAHIRFDTGWFDSGAIPFWIARYLKEPPPSRALYFYGSGVGTILFLFIFRFLGLYVRPQTGTFGDKIPRLVRAVGWGILLATALAFAIRTEPPFSRLVTALSFITVTMLVLLERWLLFRVEWNLARHREEVNRVAVLGTDAIAAHIKRALKGEPMLRSRVVAFLITSNSPPHAEIPPELIRGTLADLRQCLERGDVDQVILADISLPHDRMAETILLCEQHLVGFQMVPDLFGLLTQKVNVTMLGDVPLLGFMRWPLDFFWNRLLKRIEDVVGAMVGLIIAVPIVAVAAVLIKRSSPGPVFYLQERCGEGGRHFTLVKLRTMVTEAEDRTGPVWATPDDPRRTRVGTFLRRHNLDELPQFWNVLKGDMSLVGPRPERPHFVEQFKEDIGRYMWRHASKPGLTGWAQVNGLRGDTSIEERIRYDLYYLENWSLALDFKVLAKTLFASTNAY